MIPLDRLKRALSSRDDTPEGAQMAPVSVNRAEDVRAGLFAGHFKWVLVLFALVAAYYVVVAAPRYATTAEVYVKAADSQATMDPQLGMLSMNPPGKQDALLVQSFIRSRDMARHLQKEMDLVAHYSAPRFDVVWRLSDAPSDEEFLAYYQDRVTVELDPDSAILSIEVQAFDPAFASRLAEAVIDRAEQYINEISQSIAREDVAFVEQELARANDKLMTAQENLTRFQEKNNLLNAEASGAALQGVVNELQGELVRARAEEKRLASYLNEDAAELVAVRDRIDALESQVQQEKAKMAGTGGGAMNQVWLRYKRLELELQLATDLYTTALTSLEQTRVESYRKLKHLVTVQAPSKPQDARYPETLYDLVTLLIGLVLAYGIGVMIVATIREHRDV